MQCGEVVRREAGKIVAFGTKVVVDHVENDRESDLMTSVYELSKLFGTSIAVCY